MCLGADRLFALRIEDDEVGVRADGDGALLRIEAEEFCGSGSDELDEAVRREAARGDARRDVVRELRCKRDERCGRARRPFRREHWRGRWLRIRRWWGE